MRSRGSCRRDRRRICCPGAPPEVEELTDGLPDDLDYGNEVINILNTEYIVSGPQDFDPDVSVHEQQASVVQEVMLVTA